MNDITENEIIEILEDNILPQFKDIIGIFKDDWVDKRKPIFKKIAKAILDKIKKKTPHGYHDVDKYYQD